MSGPFVPEEYFSNIIVGDCDYYDDVDDIYYEDDCLTQQEFEDYSILQLAMEVEVDDAQYDVQDAQDFIEFCDDIREGEGTEQEIENELDTAGCPQIMNAPLGLLQMATMRDPYQLVSPSGDGTDMECTIVPSEVREQCATKAVYAGAAVVAWGFSAGKLGRSLVARAAAATLGHYTLAVVATAVVVATAYDFIECAYFGEPEELATS